ncbi:MAG: fructosamine kinase family protein [Cyanobacteria bacterium REEB498]|nr:fructosamine kinase family protein [Cyanobacteria bacterium REEB498]
MLAARLPQRVTLAIWLQHQLGVKLQGQRPVGGGCIHRAWELQLADGRRLFAKTNRAALLPVLEAEADGLAALHQAAAELRIPQPLAVGEAAGEAVLVLEWLELAPGQGGGGSHERAWWQLGAQLAALHRASLNQPGQGFGWGRHNFIGSAPQPNGWMTRWADFFQQRRLAPQLQWAAASGHPMPGADTLLERLPTWLGAHRPEPCLVHGDLWSGNAALLQGGGGAVFDPAVYRGDREVDLAMAQLFGGFPASFFAGYDATWPLPAGHRQRVELYNLYHQLNHANLFGGGYWRQAQASISHLLELTA